MQQAHDFLAESEALHVLIASLPDAQLDRATGFKRWTINTIVRHLHLWNRAADLSLTDPDEFQVFFAKVAERLQTGSLADFEAEYLPGLAGRSLVQAWRDLYIDMAARFAQVDPSMRLQWAGPSMSARSSITARLMETWAHGQAVYDELGVVRENQPRIRNIVVLGVNTYGWTFKVHGRAAPEPMPCLKLRAPSGEWWSYGEESESGRIEGLAEEFCQVVTQVRNVADTSLAVSGENASAWMAIAQCFAGPPETPPAPGTRKIRAA